VGALNRPSNISYIVTTEGPSVPARLPETDNVACVLPSRPSCHRDYIINETANRQVRANIVSENEKPNFESARSTLALTSEPTPAGDPMQAAEARMRRALGLGGEQARPPQERSNTVQRPADRFSTPGHKRRFVHDGEVPVTMVHGLVSNRRDHPEGNGIRGGANAQPTNRLEVAEAALAAEIATRERTERALAEAQAAVHDLQTKLGHADLARQEAVEALRRERESMATLHDALHELQAQVTVAREAQEAAERALTELREHKPTPPEEVQEEQPRPRRGRRPRAEMTAVADAVAAAIKPRKGPGRPRSTESKSARDPKPIRWWLASRTKKKR
jgi:hypothetical protein